MQILSNTHYVLYIWVSSARFCECFFDFSFNCSFLFAQNENVFRNARARTHKSNKNKNAVKNSFAFLVCVFFLYLCLSRFFYFFDFARHLTSIHCTTVIARAEGNLNSQKTNTHTYKHRAEIV